MKGFNMKKLLLAMALLSSAYAHGNCVVSDVYMIKQISSGNSVRYEKSKLAIGQLPNTVAPIPKTSSTLFTTWTSQPTYYIQSCAGTRNVYNDSNLAIVFQGATPTTPPDPLCKIQEAIIYDPNFEGFKLEINPTVTEPDPCYYARLVKQPSGKYSFQTYSAKQPDGSCR